MENQLTLIDLRKQIVLYKEQLVMLDSDVAKLYGVQTRDINKAVKNNPQKFPNGYVLTPEKEELANLKWKISTANCEGEDDLKSKILTSNDDLRWKNSTANDDNRSKNSTAKISPKTRYVPKLFTERGLYMLATILKSPIATRATLSIIETYAQVKQLRTELLSLHNEKDPKMQEKRMNKFGEILSEIVMPDLRTDETETTLEMNFLIGKIKHTVKRRRVNGHDEVEQH